VSKRVSALEDRVGARLIQRNTRQALPTPAGRALYERCAPALDAVDLALEEVQGAAETPRGTLRVAAPHALAVARVAPHLAEFTQRYPEVRFELDAVEREVDMIDEGLDLLIRITAELPESRLVARRLVACPQVVCAAPADLERRGTPSSIDALVAHDWLALASEITAEGIRLPLA
jgi:DNA-binding transcriptional LysR family regulator